MVDTVDMNGDRIIYILFSILISSCLFYNDASIVVYHSVQYTYDTRKNIFALF